MEVSRVFRREKFNPDDSDDLAYCRHNFRKATRKFSKKQLGGGSIMVWDAISYFGVPNTTSI